NQHLPQKALGHIAPIQALKDWRDKRPELFKKRVYNLRGLDSYELNSQAGRVGFAWRRLDSLV
ncbi:hypothetical protein CKO29_18190, partial [Allochromatium vinosum]|nr:hypothetical protein [Allochromatium vinosum]